MYEFIEPQKNVELKAFLWVAYSEALAYCRRCEYYYGNLVSAEMELPFWKSYQAEIVIAELEVSSAIQDVQLVSSILAAIRLNVSKIQITYNDFMKIDSIVKKVLK